MRRLMLSLVLLLLTSYPPVSCADDYEIGPGDVLHLTVVGQTKAGYVSITPTPVLNPTTSTLNFPLGDTRANNLTIPVNSNGKVSAVYRASAGKTANLIFDVTGYFK